ncbi:hypothetical protein JW613_32875 [Streptomyces smyrnaeus]|uniref:Uncharacterized protein n=1 Tax=Streptomyces smyrnaeus TaxID=1387713 RepID=A0ABS3Y5U3_9ACTN|nr:hypothetical protein [Streptomyces smyrnaeus]MBO8203037.1 hypothetical protein [Streptomyces smyrnaeus]
MNTETLYAELRADVGRLSAELASMTPNGPRPYRSWLYLSTAERAADVYVSAERNRIAAELRKAKDRLAEFERVSALVPTSTLQVWARVRYAA